MKNNKVKPKEKVAKEYKSTFIDSNLCKAVSKNTELIKEALAQKGNQSISIGNCLNDLKKQFDLIAKHRKNQPGTASKAFREYVQVQFDIRATRASEYIQLASVLNGLKIKLEISKLVELSRLGQTGVKIFLKKYPQEQLSSWSCRKVRDLVRESNENKRTVKALSKNKSKTEATNPEPSYSKQLRDLAKSEMSSSELFCLAVETMKSAIGSGPIPNEIIELIDSLVEWKKSKQLKVAG